MSIEFGERKSGQPYVARPGSYAILRDAEGHIGVMETPRGCFLPGGGAEGSETPEETLRREVREECGFAVSHLRRVGEAAEYVHTAGNIVGIRKECVFFLATVVDITGAQDEADHTLRWLTVDEAKVRLAHGSQRWAVTQSILGDEEGSEQR